MSGDADTVALADRLLRRSVRAMKPYTPIVPFEVLSAELGRPPEQIVKLDANENPYGPSPRSVAALQNGRYHIYPDPESRALRAALAAYTGLPADSLLAGAGADELIDLVARALIDPGDVIVDCPPSFGMYPFTAALNAARLVTVPRRADFALDVAAVETAVHDHAAKLLFVCSPNNPDGSVVDDDTLRRMLRLPALIVLDEAYVDFADEPAGRLGWVPEHDNLVVLRTFSKLAGLAGLRVGYGAFPGWLIEQLWKIKQPYNVNVAASRAALAALEDAAWLRDTTARIVAERGRLRAELAAFSWLSPRPSQANFILCRVHGRDAAAFKADLAARGVLVRYFDRPGLRDCIRVSVGRPSDGEVLLGALRDLEKEGATHG